MHRLLLIALLSAALLTPRSPAWAEDAAELLRQGGVAESVDRDPARALELYRLALGRFGPSKEAPEIMWRIARIYESQGKGADALTVLRELTKRLGTSMPESRKREIHDAMLRLVPPGGRETSPIGEIYKPSPTPQGQFEVSPLERKILNLFDRYERTAPDRRRQVRDEMHRGIWAVGTSALPVLEKIAITGTPERAGMAASWYASIGQATALEGLETMIVDGDAFTRKAAVDALRDIRANPEVSPDFVAMIDRLRSMKLAPDLDKQLRGYLASHLSGAELLARHAQGDADRWWYLDRALGERAPGALERALELVRGGGDDGRQALAVLLPYLVPRHNAETAYPMESLGKEGALQAFALLIGQPMDQVGTTAEGLVGLAKLIQSTAGDEEGTKAREALWRLFAETTDAQAQAALLRQLASNRLAPTPRLLEEETFAKAFITGNGNWNTHERTQMFQRAMEWGAPFWDAWFRYVPRLPHKMSGSIARTLRGALGNELPPAAYDEAWVDLLEKLPHMGLGKNKIPRFVIQAAARSNDPRFLDLLRKQTVQRGWVGFDYEWLKALETYGGPGRLAFVEEALADVNFPKNWAGPLLKALASEGDDASRSLLIRIASDWKHPMALAALNLLDDVRASDAVLAIASRVEREGDDPLTNYRTALMRVIQYLHLREGVPYLIHEYRRGPLSKLAAETMDAIHAYHDRLARFEAFARGEKEERESSGRKLEDLLDDEAPEIRRAAVLALAAMGRKEVLDRIVFLAKEDPDAQVREAALKAVERLAEER